MENSRTNSQPALYFHAMILLATGAQSIYFDPQLPNKVPSHFTITGEVDDDITKSTLFTIMLSVIFGNAVLLTVGTLLALKKAPQLVNLPNKEYWFAPEHKQETTAFIFVTMVKLAIASMLIMITILQSIIWFSIGVVESAGIVISIATGIVCTYFLLIIIQLNRRFRLPDTEQETPT